jgi:NAD(P)-dependent dehydrogenase (short-subunit alcohol dehydrogenase family)
MKLENKIALVTGGTKGIGAAIAVALGQNGSDVALVGRSADDEAKAVRKSILALNRRCEIIVADCARPDEVTRSVEETSERLGGVDVVVHSAGGAVPGTLLEVTPEAWYGAFEVHVHAIFHLCRAALPLLRLKKEGAVILISSAAGKLGVQGNLAYQVVKGTLPHFTRALAREFAADNIRVNCVAPGVIRTRFHANMPEAQKKLNLEQRIPLRREGTVEQVASLTLELITNDYITGETVMIDGGLTMRIA